MADRIGQQLGNYRLTGLLGRGGFADVYLGEHVYLRTQAAVKVLQARLTGPEDMQGFLQEAQTVAHLSHPHVVRILDFGMDEQTPFLVMDYAANGTLRKRHKRGERLPLSTVTRYVGQIANALQYAHDEKLIHRDVKPENMLVDKRNEIVLSDFGIALIAQSSRYQSTQDVIGTVVYMSPEQIQGKPRPASDQYSLGIVVYEWLCGSRPFSGSFTELCTQHMFAPVPSLREKMSTLSLEVEQVVTTALAKDPKQRFGSVRAFATALQHACQPEQSPASSVSSHVSIILPAHPPAPSAARPGPAASSALPPAAIAASNIPAVPVNAPIQANPTSTPDKDSELPLPSSSPSTSISTPHPAKASGEQPVVKPQPDRKPSTTSPRRNSIWPIIVLSICAIVLIVVAIASPMITTITNPGITNCNVGTGYDMTGGTIQGESNSFPSGTSVYLVCQIAPGTSQNDITGTLIGPGVNPNGAQIDTSHNVFYSAATASGSGSYVWHVYYKGQEKASVSFQVTG